MPLNDLCVFLNHSLSHIAPYFWQPFALNYFFYLAFFSESLKRKGRKWGVRNDNRCTKEKASRNCLPHEKDWFDTMTKSQLALTPLHKKKCNQQQGLEAEWTGPFGKAIDRSRLCFLVAKFPKGEINTKIKRKLVQKKSYLFKASRHPW